MTTSHLFSEQIAGIVTIEPKLQWLLVNQRAALDHNTLWTDTKAERFARLVDGLASPLVRSGRRLQAVSFQFGAECHLIVVHGGLRLCFILPSGGDKLDKIASAAMELLHGCEEDIHHSAGIDFTPAAAVEPEADAGSVVEVAEPDDEDDHAGWSAFRGFLLEVIGKILSRPQAERLIDSELVALGITGTPKPDDFERIGRGVVAHVPHRGKQASLITEVLHFLEP